MKLNLLLLTTVLPISIYAQKDSARVKVMEGYPNTFSSGASYVEKFDNKARKLNDWSISIGGGPAFMTKADLTSFYGGKVNWGWNAYASLNKQISHTFGLMLQYQLGETNQKGKLQDPYYGSLAGVATAWTKFHQVALMGDVNLSNLMRRVDNHSPYRWALHGYAGIGLQSYTTQLLDNNASRWNTTPPRIPIEIDQDFNFSTFYSTFGAGLKYKISRVVDIEGRVMYVLTGDDEFDGGGWTHEQPAAIDYNRISYKRSDDMVTVNLGLTFNLGKHISHLTWHDPLQDAYARVYALENATPNFIVCQNGDQDNDGVCDDWDRELNTPAGARVDGAGVALDLDLDGTIDLNDKCVTVPGPKENFGCPIKETPKKNVVSDDTRTLEGIEFDLNSDKILPSNTPILNNAVNYINSSNGSYKVIGATDTRATDAYNQKLSERRANNVKDYLIKNGVQANKLQAEGRGEKDLKYPECEPATKCPEWKNRANRRVYFESK
ncbi:MULTISPECIES: OmpA family protein [Amniculibacterium]|uniref:OmpA family protein n=1 Tax=Amniculibacterium TaxID=2715289 RepID=UPI000F599A04|nr:MULTISPECIES: OmpA family protein [Amniculibacterium]